VFLGKGFSVGALRLLVEEAANAFI
jgi:hypothetical protein